MNPNIEAEFKKLQDWHDGAGHKTATGKEQVLEAMLERPDKIWWWSWEFINVTTKKGDYLSHRAPARASDLAIQNPNLVEDRPIGRFKVYRLRTENLPQIQAYLSGEIPNQKLQTKKKTTTRMEPVWENGRITRWIKHIEEVDA